MALLPKQKLSKNSKNSSWGKDCINALIENSTFASGGSNELRSFYKAYNGHLDKAAYAYVTNPYNAKDSRRKMNFPAKLRSYNIIKPVVDLLLGEKSQRPFNYQVIARNSDTESKKRTEMSQAVLASMQQMFVNELNEQGMQTGISSQEVEMPEAIKARMDQGYSDSRADIGQEAMSYMTDALELPDKLQTAFFDWLVTGYVYSYKGVCMDEPDYDIVSPLDIDYHKSPDTTFIEDAQWVVRRNRMTVGEVVDNFYDLLSQKEIDRLDTPSEGDGSGFHLDTVDQSNEKTKDRLVEVIHCCWKSFKKVGLLKYTDELGEQGEMLVDESYKLDKESGEDISWMWVNQSYEGYRVDGDIYLGLGPCQVQRNQMSNYSSCKLPYNGRAYSDRYADNVSIVGMGMPYQTLYNVFHYRLELSIAKNKDKIMLMEINAIPKKHGWDEEKFMYFADAMGFAFIDSTAEGQRNERVAFNQYQVLDMSLGQYIAAQFELLQAVKQEWEDLVGVTRQRKGQVMASDGAGTTERAIFQSSVMTEELFRKFEKFEERDMQGLLDVSKFSWRNGKKAAYITSDFRQAFLSIDPLEYTESEFAVFVKNTARESEKLQTLKQLAHSFAQNGSMPSTVAEILDSDNFARVKGLLAQVEQKMQETEGQAAQAAAQAEQEKAQGEQQKLVQEQMFEADQNQLDRDKDIMLKQMDIDKELYAQDVNNNQIPDANEIEKRQIEREHFRDEMHEKKRENKSKESLDKEKLRIEEKKIDTQLKVAKENKNKYDK